MWTGVGSIVESSMTNFNLFGANNSIQTIITGIIIFLIFLRILSIIRVAKDISARTSNILLQIVSILFVTILTPILWLPLYRAMRPIGYKKENIPRREANATQLIECYNCHQLNPKEYTHCISCGEHLKTQCKQCHKYYPYEYTYCHYCGAPNIEADS